MYVLTIKFNPTATKTYDYLLVNPKGAAINTSRPLRIVTGAGRGSVSWKELTVVNKIRTDVLPDWVTSQIVLDENNMCVTERITAEHISMLRTRRVTAHVETPEPSPVVIPIPSISISQLGDPDEEAFIARSIKSMYQKHERIFGKIRN